MGISPKEIGSRIKGERLKLQYTQEQFAEMLSIGRVHLANIEAGRSVPSLDLLVEVCEITAVTLDNLVMGKCSSDLTPREKLQLAISLQTEVLNSI